MRSLLPTLPKGREGGKAMKRFCLIVLAMLSLASPVYAEEIDGKTGRTQEGLQNDAAFDKEYRARAGQPVSNVKSDPWGDVRTTPATADNKPPTPAGKAKKH
jgi:hypothetical protein